MTADSTDQRGQGVARSRRRWPTIAGIVVAAVTAFVVAIASGLGNAVLDRLVGGSTLATGRPGPGANTTGSGPTSLSWQGALTVSQLNRVLLTWQNLPAGFATSQIDNVNGNAQGNFATATPDCLDPAAALSDVAAARATARFDRTRGDLPPDSAITVYEQLDSFPTETGAPAALDKFRDWTSRCQQRKYGFTPAVDNAGTILVKPATLRPHGDEQVAITYTNLFGFTPATMTVVVVRVQHTLVFLLVQAANYLGNPPGSEVVESYLDTALASLMSLT